MANIMGKDIAFSGGGYFRFFPLSFVKSRMAKSDYTMCYFHIADLLPVSSGVPSKETYEAYYKEPGTLKNRYLRYIKENIGKKGAFNKLEKLIRTEYFENLEQVSKNLDWNRIQIIKV